MVARVATLPSYRNGKNLSAISSRAVTSGTEKVTTKKLCDEEFSKLLRETFWCNLPHKFQRFPKGGFCEEGEISIIGVVRAPVAIINFASNLCQNLWVHIGLNKEVPHKKCKINYCNQCVHHPSAPPQLLRCPPLAKTPLWKPLKLMRQIASESFTQKFGTFFVTQFLCSYFFCPWSDGPTRNRRQVLSIPIWR